MSRSLLRAALCSAIVLGTAGAAVTVSAADKAGVKPPQNLEESIAGSWRPAEDVARDNFRHPHETLSFFKLNPRMKIAEIWPGNGYYTQIIAPRTAVAGGSYRAVHFDVTGSDERRKKAFDDFKAKFADTSFYGVIEHDDFRPKDPDGGIAPAGSLDAVLTFRNVHNWIAGGFDQEAFNVFFAALKPGGVLGVVEHRLPENMTQDAKASTGYVHESYVKTLAQKAGFEFVAASDVNANPKDTHDHPFGVWTLPPVKRNALPNEQADPKFDRSKYDAIGESDRMTLLFRKPKS